MVFDEAQRAWNLARSKSKFGRSQSEPEQMLGIMSRQAPSVLVALVGGGQEINTGEAGLAEWGRALGGEFSNWIVMAGPEVLRGDTTSGTSLVVECGPMNPDRIVAEEALHLGVSQRSFRSSLVTDWVEAVLAGDPDKASVTMEKLRDYPIVLTRDLDVARLWVRERARGNRRAGLLASSGARRLRPYGVSTQEDVNEVHWFLKPDSDVRSSSFLELALSEFGVQGLEVDWAILAWGSDLTRVGGQWSIRQFRGTDWVRVHGEAAQRYAINRYRVLMTRAREGLVIWVPYGEPDDRTRDPMLLEEVVRYLVSCGVRTIS